MTDRPVTELLGVPFDRLSGAEISARIRRAAADRSKLWISTANLDWVVLAQRDRRFMAHLHASDIVTCDGAPVMHLSRIAGKPLPFRVTGVEIFRRLRAGEAGALRIGFFGAENDEAERASRALNASETPLIGAGGYNPGRASAAELGAGRHIDALNAMKADVLVLALGAVKAQEWIAANRDRLDAPVVTHLGAVVRHVSGDTREAPGLLSRLGFEWAHRALHEPALRRRYAQNFAALPALSGAALKERFTRQA